MYKDRTTSPHQLSYSAVTSYQTSANSSQPYQRYQTKEPTGQFGNTHRSSTKNQQNSDLAFLRNTIGPVNTHHNDSSFQKPTDGRKLDASLRQTMNVTSDIKDRFSKFSSPGQMKRTSRAETVNDSELTANKKPFKTQDSRLEKIMEKYEKKNQTKQAIKLLQQLKQLKKKQEQLKKQRKNDTNKDDEPVSSNKDKQNRPSYDYSSPVNFSKKNKVDYLTPTYEKKQFSTTANSPQNESYFNARVKKNSYDFTNKEDISINVNKSPYRASIKEQQQLNSSMQGLGLGSNTNKSSSNLKPYYQNSSQHLTSTSSSYSFLKGSNSNKFQTSMNAEKQQEFSQSRKYSTPTSNQNPIQKYPSTQNQSPLLNPNILSTTTRDNTTVILSKSPNSKYPRSNYTPDYLSNSVSYSQKSKSPYVKSSSKYDNSSNYDLTATNDVRKSPVFTPTTFTIPKDVFANRRLSINDFTLGKNLGQGKFGMVFQAVDKKTKCLYALKKVPKSIIKSHWMVDQFVLEVKIQNFLNHPNILSFHGCFDDQQHVYILLQYMEEGTLFLHLKKNSTLQEKQAASKLKQIALAIQYLHQNGIAHRDIKPENIVMSHGVCKLCDFGWATICDQRRKTYCGTFDYAAPQILQGSEYDMSVDLWCLGILAYEILVGKAPFYHISRKQTMKKIMNCQNQKIVYPSSMSYQARSFIQNLLRKNPEQRIKSQQLVSHPFFRLYQK